MKTVKVRLEDHRWLKMESANRGKPVYEIVTELIKTFQETRKCQTEN